MTIVHLSVHILLAPNYRWGGESHKRLQTLPFKGHFCLSHMVLSGEAILNFDLLLVRKLNEEFRAGGLVPEREGTPEAQDMGVACPLGKRPLGFVLALESVIQV